MLDLSSSQTVSLPGRVSIWNGHFARQKTVPFHLWSMDWWEQRKPWVSASPKTATKRSTHPYVHHWGQSSRLQVALEAITHQQDRVLQKTVASNFEGTWHWIECASLSLNDLNGTTVRHFKSFFCNSHGDLSLKIWDLKPAPGYQGDGNLAKVTTSVVALLRWRHGVRSW